jgi:hypothetical protein
MLFLLILLSFISVIVYEKSLTKNNENAIYSYDHEVKNFNSIFETSITYNLANNTNYQCSIYNKLHQQVKIDEIDYPILLTLHSNKSINFNCMRKKITKTKKILLWNHLLKDSQSSLPLEFKCPLKRCIITSDQASLNKSDAVLFNLNNLPLNLPKDKRTGQKWINFLTSPIDSKFYASIKKIHQNTFDWSATYDSDSNFLPYFYRNFNLTWSNKTLHDKIYKNVFMKEGIAAAIINDCDEYTDHLTYVKTIKKYVKVDIYGECGMPCPSFRHSNNNNIRKLMNLYPFYPTELQSYYDEPKCLAFIEKKYKFLFIFEKNVCRNYVTDRFFKALKYNIVPIVFRAFDHENYVPKSSFIEAFKFASVRKLADYLMHLDANQDDYMSYFNWKRYANFGNANIDPSFGTVSLLCDICIKLHLEDLNTNNKLKTHEPIINYNVNNLVNYVSSEACYRLDVQSYVAIYYTEELTDKDPTYFSFVKRFFRYDIYNLYYSKSFSGIFDKVYGIS